MVREGSKEGGEKRGRRVLREEEGKEDWRDVVGREGRQVNNIESEKQTGSGSKNEERVREEKDSEAERRSWVR